MSDSFDDSSIFKESLSMWRGIKQINQDGSYLYEDSDFEPILLDVFTAASLGENELMLDILDTKDRKPSARNKGGWSAIMYAAYMGHASTTKLLLEAGADPNQRSPRGSTCLILAAMCGNNPVIEVLLQHGADLEGKDNRGWTAMFHASSAGHQGTTKFLIEGGANCEIVEPSQQLTPLMEAAASGHEIIVQQLINRGVDMTRRDQNNDTALMLAIEYEHTKVASIIEAAQVKTATWQQQQYCRQSQQGGHGLSGPDINAGPRAFARMTGLGKDGKPKPDDIVGMLFPEQPNEAASPKQFQSNYKGAKDLKTLLDEINCGKFLKTFNEQDIDMRVYLTLNELDLKEIGINILGPRKKMLRQIARVNSELKVCLEDHVEMSYADSMAAKYQDMQAKYVESEERLKKMQSSLDQECHLRKVTETVLMEHKETRSVLHSHLDTWKAAQGSLLQLADQIRSWCSRVVPNNNNRQADSGIVKLSRDFDTILHHTRDCLVGMQTILQKSSSR